MSLCTSLFCGSGALSPCPESADACPPRQHVRLSHEAEQSHRFPVSSASCFDSPRFSDDHSGGGRCWTRFRQSPAAVRAQVAGKASLKTDLEAVGFTVNVAVKPSELLHLHRQRLTARCRSALVTAVCAFHIIGDDTVDSEIFRGGVW